MKTQFILAPAMAAALMGPATAATVVFDDFSTGAYSIGYTSPGLRSDGSVIVSPFADRRSVLGSGQSNWSSTAGDGTFTYSLDLIQADLPSDQMIRISYLGEFNLHGYDAFVIHVGSVVGSGQIMAHVGANSPNPSVIPMSLTEGDLVIPFANMGSDNPYEPDVITFHIIPQDRDFSVTISGIGVIPEPSTAAAGLGVFLLMARRRRETQ